MYIIGNPILGMNFRHHMSELKLTNDGLFYVNLNDEILLTSDPKNILEMMGMDSSVEYNEDNDDYFMVQLEKSNRFFRSFFLNSAKKLPFGELHFVKKMVNFLNTPGNLTPNKEGFQRFDLYYLMKRFAHLEKALETSTEFQKNEFRVYKGMNGVVIKEHFPDITGPEIGFVMTYWNCLDRKLRVQYYLNNSTRELIKQILNGEELSL